jgi:hypothetical protein
MPCSRLGLSSRRCSSLMLVCASLPVAVWRGVVQLQQMPRMLRGNIKQCADI